jgi:hypothetical protein
MGIRSRSEHVYNNLVTNGCEFHNLLHEMIYGGYLRMSGRKQQEVMGGQREIT